MKLAQSLREPVGIGLDTDQFLMMGMGILFLAIIVGFACSVLGFFKKPY